MRRIETIIVNFLDEALERHLDLRKRVFGEALVEPFQIAA